jgi:hypothetical protein
MSIEMIYFTELSGYRVLYHAILLMKTMGIKMIYITNFHTIEFSLDVNSTLVDPWPSGVLTRFCSYIW